MTVWTPGAESELSTSTPGLQILSGKTGEALTRMDAIFLDGDTSEYLQTDANVSARQLCDGLAIYDAASGSQVLIFRKGLIIPGATLVKGTLYVASRTPGGVETLADLTTGDMIIKIGFAVSTTVLDVNIEVTGIIL